MRRRTVLAGAAALLGGCLAGPGDLDDEPTESTSSTIASTSTANPAETTTGTPSTTTGSSPSTTAHSQTTRTDDTRTERVVVENRTDGEHVVDVAVRRDGERLAGGRFRVPARTGIRLPGEFEWARYLVRGRLAGGAYREREWEPDSCAPTPHPDGNMNAGVVVGEDGVRLVVNGCDYIKLGEHYVDRYAPAADYRITTAAGT